MNKLRKLLQNPVERFCFFTGNRHPEIRRILGVDHWDWTPEISLNIEPYYWNTHTLALAFGCDPLFTSEGKEWVKPMIADPAMIKDVAIPDVFSGRTGEILNIARKLLEANNGGTLIRLPDIQSPLGVAELMMGDQVYFSLMTNQNELHDLLEKITIFTIQYIRAFQDLLGDKLNPACHPQIWCDPVGYYISDDANSMVSPEMHKEFSVDYINRITREIGPVIYHTCTWTKPYYQNIQNIESKKIVNWSLGTSDDPLIVIEQNAGKSIIAPHIGIDCHKENGIVSLNKAITSEADVIRYLIDNLTDNATMYLRLEDSLIKKPEIIKEIYHIFEKSGFLPKC